MLQRIVFSFFALLFMLQVLGQHPYFQQQVDYQIRVELNDMVHSLNGNISINYTNHSPDTLAFIWFHLWPNAYKNDRTAFSEQVLQNGRTDFYFAPDSSKGFINQLNFTVDNEAAQIELHPKYTDVVKLLLPKTLLPGQTIQIATPFHVLLPFNFSRGGHIGQFYQITQWFPKPAVYDVKGWHPIPYLDQGEFYSEFGNFDVQITLPTNYLVAAGGILQDAHLLNQIKKIAQQEPLLQANSVAYLNEQQLRKKLHRASITGERLAPPSEKKYQTWHYTLQHAHDFAWFASKQFVVAHNQLALSAKSIDVFAFYHPWDSPAWKESINYAKAALQFYNNQLGNYPYGSATIVAGNHNLISGGMEYPSITLITTPEGGTTLDATIAHELGHNWFYGALASNERDHAWMDEGMNTFYENKYMQEKYGNNNVTNNKLGFFERKGCDSLEDVLLRSIEKMHQAQPIDQASEKFTPLNYGLIVYIKGSKWMKTLEQQLGTVTFAKAMKSYYQQWQFRHPYPIDFKQAIELSSGKTIDSLYQQLFTIDNTLSNTRIIPKRLKLTGFFSLKNTNRYNYISILPMLGANRYDKIMLGGVMHNYQLPANRFQFMVAPLYATGTKQWNWLANADFHWHTNGSKISKWNIGLTTSRFSTNSGLDTNGNDIATHFTKFVPYVKIMFKNSDMRSKLRKWLDIKVYLLQEQTFNYAQKLTDTAFNTNFYPSSVTNTSRFFNQYAFHVTNQRALYPYSYLLQLQHSETFYKATVTGNYFFNYVKSGGLSVRLYACKFGYIGDRTTKKYVDNLIYRPKLTAVSGNEDYAYNNYFIGRSEFTGLQSQQIMMREGDIKLRIAKFPYLEGYSDNWVAAANFCTSIPKSIMPLPIKWFLDIGTQAEAWDENANGSKFLYASGLQVSLFKNLVNIYAPVFYSKAVRDADPTTTFLNRISFSIDIQKFTLQKLNKDLPF